MSNFTGVTFAQQKVLPSDDAIIRRSLLSDGFLYGCELSYSGSTLTMAAGQLLACGRQFRHPSSQNWAVVDATSGFARLVLTVDLTRTSTKEVFEQIIDSLEYASSVDGFPELDQTDINTSGTRYQVAACVVSLGTGGITGIVSQLGPCEGTGGGGLNFSVVGGLTLPANHKENTIWVETDVPITSYTFSATEPEAPEDGKDGMVWITTGAYSTVEFNALKKNGLQVYPISAKQYVGGAWVDKTAKSYQGGEWVDWWDGTLYFLGDEYKDFTGGWERKSGITYREGVNNNGTITKNQESIYFKDAGYTSFTSLTTKKKINLSSYNTITVRGTVNKNFLIMAVHDFETGNTATDAAVIINVYTSEKSADISALEGEYYITIGTWNDSSYTVNHIFLI